jgi:hypothetical protein
LFLTTTYLLTPPQKKKTFGKTWGLSRPFGHISVDSRPIPAANQNLKFQKYEIFAIFEQILDFFFSVLGHLKDKA